MGILYTVYHYYNSPLALCMQITKAHFVQYELTFWFMCLVYVLDFAVFFGSEIVGILTVCGFGAGRWYKILTIWERGVAILQRFGGGVAQGGVRVLHAYLVVLLDFF